MSTAALKAKNTPGVRRAQLKPCAHCGHGVAKDNHILSTRVRVTRLGVNLTAVRQQAGLEMMLGSPTLAHHMGPDEELLIPLEEEVTALICDTCAMTMTVAELWALEQAARAKPAGGPS